jgi:hypothetical protein
MEVDVEVLDLTEEEARVLLLSLDPLASLADSQEQLRTRLEELTPADSPDLVAAWSAAANALLEDPKPARGFGAIPEQYLILVTCRDEDHQRELLSRFHADGLDCKALLC